MGQKSIKTWDFLSQFYGFIIVLSFMCVFWISYAIHMNGPTFIEDSNDTPVEGFIGQHARRHFNALTQLGPRVVGSLANEQLTIDLLRTTIDVIIANKHDAQFIEMDHQIQSGYNYFDGKPFGTYRIYDSVQNIVVRIKSDNIVDSPSILVNSHFDSVPGSPGGADDGIMVAVMLETLRVMSRLQEKPKNDIIFLFNGAEEVGLLASHAFIKHHAWADSCKFLVNLEATGGSGKEILFQTGPGHSWLLDYYSDVPHPHGQVFGEELFQSGLIPSDTDFRVFRDDGHLIGFDFALYQDGSRYHTPYDNIIDDEWFQHTGDNVLHLVRKMADDQELYQRWLDSDSAGEAVYFDFLGGFFVYYGRSAAIALNLIISIASLGSFAWSFYRIPLDLKPKCIYSLVSLGLILLGFVLGVAFNIAIGSILDAVNRTMTWYSSNALVFSLYCLPAVCFIFASVTVIKFYAGRNWEEYEDFTNDMQAEYLCHMHRLIWTVVLIVLTGVGVRSAYVLVPYILFTTIGLIISQCIVIWKPQLNLVWIPIYIIALIMPSMFTAYLSTLIMQLLIPIMGRFGDGINPELIIGGISTVLTIFYICTCASFMVLQKKARYFYIVMAALYVIFIIVLATPPGFPYSVATAYENPKPQRYSLVHTKRTIRNNDNGIIISNAGFTFNANDRNSPYIIEDEVPGVKYRVSLRPDCVWAIFCGLPNTISTDFTGSTIWSPTYEDPIFPMETTLLFKGSAQENINLHIYSFDLIGPDRMKIVISPRPDVKLVSMSLVDEVYLEDNTAWNNQMVHYFSYTSGQSRNVLTFDIKVLDSNTPQLDKKFDISVIGSYVHNQQNVNTQAFEQILGEFPEWTITNPTLAVYDNYVY